MATAATVPVEQYLLSEYEPDADYVDGVVEHRPMGEYDHSTWQQAIEKWFDKHAKDWDIRVRCELRVQVSPTRYRVPDVVVFDRSRAIEQILTHPPIAVFEVLSPEDTISRLLMKLEDYQRMGVLNIFMLDPRLERAYRFEGSDLRLCAPSVSLAGSSALVDWEAVSKLRD